MSDFAVVDDKGKYLGILSMMDLQNVLLQPEAAPLLLVGEVCRSDVPPLLLSDSLETAIDLFARHKVNSLAVLGRQVQEGLAGILTRGEAMKQYHMAMS